MERESKKRKVLVITPDFSFPPTGAEQMDRVFGFAQLLRLGCEVRVVAKLAEWHSAESVAGVRHTFGITVIPVQYKYSNRDLSKGKIKHDWLRRFSNPLFFDGAAFEYAEPEIKGVFAREINGWQPDVAFFDYTYLWPLYGIAKKAGIPIVTRSINFEPSHFLQEDGRTPINLLKFLPKFASEYVSLKKSDWVFAVTPHEEQIYRKLGITGISTLPLRGLPDCVRSEHQIRARSPLHVFFFGSTYSVSHNRRAAEFFLKEIAPAARTQYKGEFVFHLSGRKLPEEYKKFLADDVIYHGFLDVAALDKLLSDMDIALIPSFFGAGMQQKIFEPLCRGIPTITSERGIAGYPFRHKENVYFAKTAEDFVAGLLELKDVSLRKKLSEASIKTAQKIFSQDVIDSTVRSALDKTMH